MAQKRILKISGHCQDRFTASLNDGKPRTDYGPDYVPSDMGIGGGDSIDLEIDIDTGQILNWKKPDSDTIDDNFPLTEVE
jgi:hypothetical protein